MTGAGADPLERAAQLRRAGTRFALASVVRSVRPASARPGDRAIVLEDGSLEGWIGGSCAKPVVQREALRALAEGRPRLVRLSPDQAEWGRQEEGVASYPMTCHSGGTLEIYVEPFVPAPRLVVLGDSPVAAALATLGEPLGFTVETELPGAPVPGSDTWVVVAAMGSDDELVVGRALESGARYVGLVASARRAETIRDVLRDRGMSAEVVGRLKAPAGLDIGAKGGPEIALSILAEVVQLRRSAAPVEEPAIPSEGLTAIDPVCDMEVEVASARWTSEYQGRTVFFCAPGCKRRFERDPEAYAEALSPTLPAGEVRSR